MARPEDSSDRESKYPLPVALMVTRDQENWDQEKRLRRPDTPPRFKLMCPSEPLPTASTAQRQPGELHVGPRLIHPEPATLDSQLHAGAVFGRRAAFLI